MSNPNIGKEASKGGKARAKKLTKQRRKEIALMGAYATRAMHRAKKLVDKASALS